MAQPERTFRRRRAAASYPAVESNVVMVAACGDEGRLELLRSAHIIEADDVRIKIDGFLNVAHIKMHVADTRLARKALVKSVVLAQMRKQGVQVQRFPTIAHRAV